MSIYCIAYNWGKGFITHEEKEKGSIAGYPGGVWVVSDHMGQWVAKVNGTRKTRSEAQAIVDPLVAAHQQAWDDDPRAAGWNGENVKGVRPADVVVS